MGRYVHLEDCIIKRQTDAAFLVEYMGEDVWLPRSQIADGDDYSEGDEVTLTVTRWIADQKKLEFEEN